MNKKYMIAVAVSIALFAAFMVYRSHRKKVEQQAYREKQTDHMIEIARNSPRAGLGKVGRALKRYYADHGNYPARLTDLYSKYIGNKAFLTEVDWHYEPKGVDFYLSKTTYVKGKKSVAYVDNRLRPETEKEIMVAQPTPVTRVKPLKKPKSVAKKEPQEKLSQLELARKQFFEALSRGRIGVASVYSPQDDEVRLISTLIPEVLSTSSAESDMDIESELSRNYLVWKGEGGTLGFGNSQYPSTNRLSIFAIGQWYHLQMPPQPVQETVGDRTVTGKKPELLASALQKNFLIWKDKTGSIGFGNTDYPAQHIETIFRGDAWQGLKKGFEPTSRQQEEPEITEVSKDQIFADLGKRYLVWKGKEGVVGFGNVQYPQKNLDGVLQGGDWMAMRSVTDTPSVGAPASREDPASEPAQDIASRFARRFLVWRDTSGVVGFGNTQYPEKDVSAIRRPGHWESFERSGTVPEGVVEESVEEVGPVTGTRFASKMSTRCLVWKGKGGTLGFGNLQYPKTGDVSSVCVNGDWRPASE